MHRGKGFGKIFIHFFLEYCTLTARLKIVRFQLPRNIMKATKLSFFSFILVLSISSYAKSLVKMTIDGNKLGIAYEKTDQSKEVKAAGMIPRGSALITDSGELKSSGITHIIHAATGSMTKSSEAFKPTLEGITNSIINSISLAHEFKHKTIAIPFLGGGIFLGSLGLLKKELAKNIIQAALNNNPHKLIISFVTWSSEETRVFKDLYQKLVKDNSKYKVVRGSITDFNIHKSSVIVNAANMEVIFGGGLSGVIGEATKSSTKIDSSAKKFIEKFNEP